MATGVLSTPLPAREAMRALPRWTWVPVALAVAAVIVTLLTADAFSLEVLLGTVVATGPFLAAAALLAVAPRERLLNMAAIGFAFLPTTSLVLQLSSADLHDLLRMTMSGYAELAEKIHAAAVFLAGLNWLFYTGAILCLAFYIGIVRSRRGWWIVGIAVAVAGIQTIVNVATSLPFWEAVAADPESGVNPLLQSASTVLLSLELVAWGYLAAVALDRRLVLIAFAVGLMLVQHALGFFTWLALSTFPSDLTKAIDADVMIYSSGTFGFYYVVGFSYVLSVTFWTFLILGILLELPRNRFRAAAISTAPAEATGNAK